MPVMIHRQSCLLHVFPHWRRARRGGFEGQAVVGVQHYHSESGVGIEIDYLENIELLVSKADLRASPERRLFGSRGEGRGVLDMCQNCTSCPIN